MAQIPFRGNLQTTAFPLLSHLAGPTVIDSRGDQTFVPNVSSSGEIPLDRGVPQLFYCHNIMPSIYGLQSVNFQQVFAAPASATVFDEAQLVFATRGTIEPTPTGFRSYVAIGKDIGLATNALYVVDVDFLNWRKITAGQPVIPDGTIMTTATVNGVTYIFLSGIGAFFYDDTIDTLLPRTLDGLAVAEVLGIATSNGYMFAWKSNAVAWSSVVDVEDFVPSDVSGAGGGSLQEAEGRIVTVRATNLGFIIYTEANAVSATYSGNQDFPWVFKGLVGSGGIASAKQVSRDQVAGEHYAYTTSGMQKISHVKTTTVLPNVTDFLGGNVFEDFDSATDIFTRTEFDGDYRKQVSLISDRYLVISYGLPTVTQFTHAIVVDLVQARMGKIKQTHAFVFDRVDITEGVVETARKSITLLQNDGVCSFVDFDLDNPVPQDSVLILGKFQLTRSRLTELQEVQLENIRTGTIFSCDSYTSLDGKNLGTPSPGYLLSQSQDFRHYLFDNNAGINCSLLLKGTFDLISYVLWITAHGRY